MRIRATVVLAPASAAAGMRGGPADEVEAGMGGAGRIANMEKPQEFDSAVLEFLKAEPAAR